MLLQCVSTQLGSHKTALTHCVLPAPHNCRRISCLSALVLSWRPDGHCSMHLHASINAYDVLIHAYRKHCDNDR